MFKKIKKSSFNILFITILGIASFLRFFRLSDLLGFWYDQGRDALVIWDIIYKHKLTLIGPQMGFTGIFRGGWYYWMLTPFYYLSGGSPILPYIFVILTSIGAIVLLFLLGKKIQGNKTAVISAIISCFSVYIINASRWFSDPTPTLLISMLLLFSLYKFIEGNKYWFVLSCLFAGFAIQFSAATEIFYIPAIILIAILFRKTNKLDFRTVILAAFSYLIPFIPQLLFEIRHPGVQSNAFINFIFHEKTFTYAFWEILKDRLLFDYKMIASIFWTNNILIFAPFFMIFLFCLTVNWKKFWSDKKFKILFVLSVMPLFFTLFFVSNLGGVYEYYFTGYYLIWILLFSYVYADLWKKILGKIIITVFLGLVVILNLTSYSKNYTENLPNLQMATFKNEIAAIDWVYTNSGKKDFNVDVYVPPVIPYAYDYLFKWLGTAKYAQMPTTESVNLLFTIYEQDNNHPERLNAWLERQKGIGTIIKEEKFGIIVVQERHRIGDK